jgi:DsbC/DsbD-like thiol-disulfide interchange protein
LSVLFLVKMHRAAFLSVCLTAWLAVSPGSHANDNPLRIDLVSEVTSIQPGQPFYVGLHLQHPQGYHTYWKFPGIVGVPTGAAWTLPKGFSAGPIEWPEPQTVFMYQIKAQGYNGEIILPILITPPKDLAPDSRVKLAVKASWMCCGVDCNPGFKDLSLELPVKDVAPQADERWHHLFQIAHETVPASLQGWQVAAQRDGDRVLLKLTAQTEAAQEQCAKIKEMTFFTGDGFINASKDQRFAKPQPGVITLDLPVSEYATDPKATQFAGVLKTPQGWTPGSPAHSVSVSASIHG